MRKFKIGLITLAASAAVLAPAGSAAASAQSTSAPVKHSTPKVSCLLLCEFDIVVGDVLSYNNIPVALAANVCNTNVGVLSAMIVNQTATCKITQTQTATITRVK